MHSYRQDQKDNLVADANGPATVPKEGSGGALATTTLTASAGVTTVALDASGVVHLTNGAVYITNLPTSDPSESGRLWINAGVLTVSA